MINRIYHSCSCIIEFIKLIAKKEMKCSASLAIYLFSSTPLINSINHEHSCKILYIYSTLLQRLRNLLFNLVPNYHFRHARPFTGLKFQTFFSFCSQIKLGDNCIQNFIRGGISSDIRLSVGNFRTYIPQFAFPNENFEYGYPHSNALLQFPLKLKCCKQHKAAHHPTKCDIINGVKLFPTGYTVANF